MNFELLLEEKQHVFINQYIGMLSTIQEALVYLEPCFNDLAKAEADFILSEILLSLEQIAKGNTLLKKIFNEQEGIQAALDQFNDMTEFMWMIDDHQGDRTSIQSVLQELLPVFSKWKVTVESEFIPYLTH
ncbi:hypothetical protein [Rossellomorea vietnamensis]|uniref:hypothetical protein n=1 Tax=Rossellomorea vietnamensis TaxID=218284 RepID=UPI00054FEE33|nr:hypothetical protein [Rossellomorea vietnamensis]